MKNLEEERGNKMKKMKKTFIFGIAVAFFLFMEILSGNPALLQAAPASDPQNGDEVSLECLLVFLDAFDLCLEQEDVKPFDCFIDSLLIALEDPACQDIDDDDDDEHEDDEYDD